MVSKPTTEDVRRAREQAVAVLSTAADGIRTPLLAVLGAGDMATQAVIDAVGKARTRVNEGTTTAKGAVDTLPRDLAGLREKVDPAELRKLVDEYTDAAQKLYVRLAGHGEGALTKLKTQPQVSKAIDQLEEAISTLQDRVGDVAGDARELAEEVLAKVTRRTRLAGEKTASVVERVAEDTALAVEEFGGEVAEDLRGATGKAADKAADKTAAKPAPRKTAPRAASVTRKTNGAPKTTK
jgi:heparin binding hemagglutinin HbhA